MQAVVGAPPWTLITLLIVMGSLLVAGLIWIAKLLQHVRSRRRQLSSLGEELEVAQRRFADTQSELQDQATLLLEMEKEVSRLKRIPKAELLPMMQLAHELRSPLAAVQHSLEMVLQGYTKNNPELHDEMLSMAQGRTVTMLERINDFLRLGAVKYAEIEQQRRHVQLVDVVKRLAPEMRVRARWVAVDLYLDLPDTLPPVLAVDEDIEHLVSNLINNAIKYTEPGGKVKVSLKAERGNVIGIVEDTGIGIAGEEIPRIFDEFYRSDGAKDKAQGTGLGLSIVKRVLDLYGGQIEVESEPGKGSKFTFSFPAMQEAKETGQ
jgi:two-component system phosphate regulon sensor histidine kinase PhoR